MAEWSRPRTTPMAGRRKATLRYCETCLKFHTTHRSVEGDQACQALKEARQVNKPSEFPHIRQIPKMASNM